MSAAADNWDGSQAAAPAARVLSAPADAYTADLLAAVPVIRAEAGP